MQITIRTQPRLAKYQLYPAMHEIAEIGGASDRSQNELQSINLAHKNPEEVLKAEDGSFLTERVS